MDPLHEEIDDVGDLRRALRNELGAPELLPFAQRVVAALVSQLASQQSVVDEATASGDVDEAFAVTLYQMEIDRLRYMLSSYLRTRLRKIEQQCLHILQSQERTARLSPQEAAFAEGYVQLLDEHMNRAVLNRMPEGFQGLMDKSTEVNMVDGPDLDRFVFCRGKEDVGMLEVSATGQRVNMREGDVYVLRYEPLRDLVVQGAVELI